MFTINNFNKKYNVGFAKKPSVVHMQTISGLLIYFRTENSLRRREHCMGIYLGHMYLVAPPSGWLELKT